MQLSHTHRSLSASFDDANLVSSAGLVPVMALAAKTGLGTLVDAWVKLLHYPNELRPTARIEVVDRDVRISRPRQGDGR